LILSEKEEGRMDMKKELQNNIKKLRVWRGMKQRELATASGISINEVRLLENNNIRYPHNKTIENVSKALDMPINKIFFE